MSRPPSVMLPPRASAFTLLELLVVIVVIVALLGMLLPVIIMVREQARRNQAAALVAQLHHAVQAYASEERRHRFPPAATDLALGWAPPEAASAAGVLNLLQDQGIEVDRTSLDHRGTPPFRLLDPWKVPFRYQADNDLLGVSGAQRPLGCDGVSAPLSAWNAAGIRPWGYVWSVGKDATADGTGWIYQRDNR